MSSRFYILYDGRAAHGTGTDDATVLDTAESIKEARRIAYSGDHGEEVAVYSYARDGKKLTDGQFEFNTCGQ